MPFLFWAQEDGDDGQQAIAQLNSQVSTFIRTLCAGETGRLLLYVCIWLTFCLREWHPSENTQLFKVKAYGIS